MPLSFVAMELLAMLAFSSLSLVIVEVEGDREKVLARGPRCVSLSSVGGGIVSKSRYQIPQEVGVVWDLTANLEAFQDSQPQDE